jgi:hypothetical protein
MATLYLRKLYDKFVPIDEASAEAMEKMPPNTEFKAELTRPRNLQFHRKAFALLGVVYEAWDVQEREHQGQKVAKNIECLREDMTILAGYYTVEYKYDGSLRLKAKSWAFANMSEEDFGELYSKLIDVALTKILSGYTKADIDEQVNRILGFC